MKIYVVGYDPVNDMGGGGFEWRRSLISAMSELDEQITHNRGTHFIWFRECEVPDSFSGEDIEQYIMDNAMVTGCDGDW
jgi:hypothetical protein